MHPDAAIDQAGSCLESSLHGERRAYRWCGGRRGPFGIASPRWPRGLLLLAPCSGGTADEPVPQESDTDADAGVDPSEWTCEDFGTGETYPIPPDVCAEVCGSGGSSTSSGT